MGQLKAIVMGQLKAILIQGETLASYTANSGLDMGQVTSQSQANYKPYSESG